jgi:DNA repair ATPase RecN
VLRWLVERKLTDTTSRLRKAREELAILDEQGDFFAEEAEDARIRSVIAETPGAVGNHNEAQRHVNAMAKARQSVTNQISDLLRQQDELLDKLSAHP